MIVVVNLKNKYSTKTAFQLIAQHLQNSAYCYVDTLLLGHTAVGAYHHNCRLHHSLQRHKAASQLASQLRHSRIAACITAASQLAEILQVLALNSLAKCKRKMTLPARLVDSRIHTKASTYAMAA